LLYFVLMFVFSLFASRAVGLNYAKSTSVAFTASGNNFELAIAVSIGTFGMTSRQPLAGVVGPLIEVPVLVGLVYVALWLGPRLFPGDPSLPNRSATGAQSGQATAVLPVSSSSASKNAASTRCRPRPCDFTPPTASRSPRRAPGPP